MKLPQLPVTLKLPFRILLALLALNLLFRVVFFVYNSTGGGDFSWGEALLAFLVGIRYDCAAIAYTSGVLLLFLSLPTGLLKRVGTYKAVNVGLIVVNTLATLVNAIDVIYYGFATKWTTHEFFTTKGDLASFSLADFVPYWWLFVVWVGSLVVLGRLLGRWRRTAVVEVREVGSFPRWYWGLPLLVVGLLFVGIRGGFQLRPLRPANAFVTSSFFLGNVSLNTAYTVLSSIDIGKERPVAFMEEAEAVELTRWYLKNDFDGEYVSDEYPLVRRASFEGEENRKNVVLLIIESFNALKVGTLMGLDSNGSLTPNFDTLARHGLLYTNFYSNGSRSVESLPALLNSMPDIFRRPMIGSSFETNAHWGIGNILNAKGYHTSFFCGGENGTMGFDAYSRVSGFQHYYGRDEFPGETDANTGSWGVHDLAFSQWMAGVQGEFQEPFLSAWFSISHHFPFDMPGDCPGGIVDAKGMDGDDRTLKYTDYALGQYFKAVRGQAWFKNTIFLITGDHCFYAADAPPRPMMTNFKVPLLILGPGVEAGRVDALGCHLNVMPTLIELLRLDTYHASAGVSLFSKGQAPIALNNLMGVATIATDSVSYSTNFDQVQPCYLLRDGDWVDAAGWGESEAGKGWDRVLRAMYQVNNNVRIENRFIGREYMR